MKATPKSQKGQILILFVLGLVGLLGFTALAIDGGMVYADRRYDQTVADSTTWSASQAASDYLKSPDPSDPDFSIRSGNFACPPANLDIATFDFNYTPGLTLAQRYMAQAIKNGLAAGQYRYTTNGITNPDGAFDYTISDQMGITWDCEPDPGETSLNQYIDFQSNISAFTKTSFAQIVFGRDMLRNTVESVVRYYPIRALGFGAGIATMDEDPSCNGQNSGMVFSGKSTINVTGGGIISNSCISGSGTGSVTSTGTIYSTNFREQGGYNITPNGVNTGDKVLPTPFDIDCDQLANSYASEVGGNGNGTLNPGVYHRGIHIQGGTWTMNPGLYCIHGDFQIDGGTVAVPCDSWDSVDTNKCTDADGVTVFFQPSEANGQASNFIINPGGGNGCSGNGNGNGGGGNASVPVVRMYAPTDDDPNLDHAIPGLLFYMDEGNEGVININGSSQSTFRGTIYAPDGDVSIEGTNNTSPQMYTQIIAYDFSASGCSNINIIYDQSIMANIPATVSQHR